MSGREWKSAIGVAVGVCLTLATTFSPQAWLEAWRPTFAILCWTLLAVTAVWWLILHYQLSSAWLRMILIVAGVALVLIGVFWQPAKEDQLPRSSGEPAGPALESPEVAKSKPPSPQESQLKESEMPKPHVGSGNGNVSGNGNKTQTMINSPGGIQAGGDVNILSDKRILQSISLRIHLETPTVAKQAGAPQTDFGLGSIVALFTNEKVRIRFASDYRVVEQQVASTRDRLSFEYGPETPEEILGKEVSFLASIGVLAVNYAEILKNYPAFTPDSDGLTYQVDVLVNGIKLAELRGGIPKGELMKGQMVLDVSTEFARLPDAYAKAVAR